MKAVPKLSAVVVAQNEARNIARCLASLGFTDEIVVVDALSTDETPTIARRYGAKVFTRRWDGFASQKQFAIDRAGGDWVLLVDSDEEVTPELASEIRDVIASDPPMNTFRITRRNQFLGRWVRFGPWARDEQVRLFRRGSAAMADRPVHEGIESDGATGGLHALLNHYTHQTIDESFRRLNRYTTLEAGDRAERRRIRLMDAIILPAPVFLRYYFSGCWRDGVRGFLLAATTAMYRSVLYVKTYLLQRGNADHSP